MSPRFGITTFATLALLFLALVLGARGISRDLEAPFEGLEQLAKSRGAIAAVPEDEFQEPIRNIDWDEPAQASPATRTASKPTAMLALSRALRIEAGESLVDLSLRQLAGVEFTAVQVKIVGEEVVTLRSGEPDLETLTTLLNLNESQKAMVSALLDWRQWSLDNLAQLNGDADSKERINGSFREAVESLLDPDQAERYKLSNRPLTSLAMRASLTAAGSSTASQTMRRFIQRAVSEGK